MDDFLGDLLGTIESQIKTPAPAPVATPAPTSSAKIKTFEETFPHLFYTKEQVDAQCTVLWLISSLLCLVVHSLSF